MMELEHKAEAFSASVPEIASTSNFSELAMVNAEELAAVLLSKVYETEDNKPVVLDCRPPGALPTIRHAHPIFLPGVLLRRLNNGTIQPTSISPVLGTSNRNVIIVPDSMQSSSLASRVCNNLLRRHFTVAFLSDDVQELANISPELCTESVINGLNVLAVRDFNKPSGDGPVRVKDDITVSEDSGRRHRCKVHFPVQILPYLYLGNDETAKDKEILKRYNVRYVINVTNNLPNYFHDDPEFKYLRIGVDDTCSHNLIEHFPTAISIIEQARDEKKAVFVHCWAGISRSVTICLAYLMQATHSTLEQAFDFLLKQNGSIAPNFHFMGQLIDFERSLFDKTSTSSAASLQSASNLSAVSSETSSGCSTV